MCDPLIQVKSGAVLIIKDSSLDLTNHYDRTMIQVEKGAELIFDNSVVSGERYIFIRDGVIAANEATVRFKNHSVIENNNGNNNYQRHYEAVSLVKVTNGTLTVEDSEIRNNGIGLDYGITIFETPGSDVDVRNSEFRGNRGHGVNGMFHLFKSKSLSLEGNGFYENTGLMIDAGGCQEHSFSNDHYENNNTVMYIQGGRVGMKNETFSGNEYVMRLYDVEAFIDKCSFSSSTRNGILNYGESRLFITDSSFINNKTTALRYVILSVESFFTDVSWTFDNQVTGDPILSITGSEFRDNQAENAPAALFAGNFSDGNRVYPIVIRDTVFVNNSSRLVDPKRTYEQVAELTGGAVYLGIGSYTKIDGLTIIENKAGALGGGIAVGPTGRLIIHPRNGASVFSNTGSDNGEPADILFYEWNDAHTLPGKLSNGGTVEWDGEDILIRDRSRIVESGCYDRWNYQCQRYQIDCDADPYALCMNWIEREEYNGRSFAADPERTDVPENTSVLLRKNQTLGEDPFNAYGGGIALAGTMEVGEPGSSFMVRKVWQNMPDDLRPEPGDFLQSLTVRANGVPFDTGAFHLRRHATVETQGDEYLFSIENDPFAAVRLTDRHDGTWQIIYEDLPALIDDAPVTYTVSENSGIYDAEVSGNMTDGFVVVNSLRPTAVPTMTPVPTSAAVPDPGFLPLFKLTDRLEAMPRTGFPAGRPSVLKEMPKDIRYGDTGLRLEIPILSVSAEILTVPFFDGEYLVDRLGSAVGLPEGFPEDGSGQILLAGHNHLNNTEAGPFALLRDLSVGDLLFLVRQNGSLSGYKVYANELIGEDDMEQLQSIADGDPYSLTLMTCENERVDGGYQNRRIICARPL